MIDPLRPYWPTNRSIAGLLVRSVCLLAAGSAVGLAESRSFAFIVVCLAGTAQASFLIFEWMELKRAGRRGLVAMAIIGLIFLSLIAVLVVESRWVLVSSVRG